MAKKMTAYTTKLTTRPAAPSRPLRTTMTFESTSAIKNATRMPTRRVITFFMNIVSVPVLGGGVLNISVVRSSPAVTETVNASPVKYRL